MSDERIDELWRIAYGNEYLQLPREMWIGGRKVSRNELTQRWLNSLPIRPHQRFARLLLEESRA